MTSNFEIHPIQGKILRELLFHPRRKFSELNADNVPTDQFTFHVKRLVELDLVQKTDDGYELTTAGKEFANRFDTETVKIERQAKLGALVVCVREQNGKREYLLQQRLKQPYYGFYGFVGGKIRWGETAVEAAGRELEEETGLQATLAAAGIEHKMDYRKGTGELLEDKFFYFFRGERSTGTLIETFEGGRNAWLTKDDVLKLPDLFPDVREGLDLIEGAEFKLVERQYEVEKY